MAPRKGGPRRTLAPNVYADNEGISAIARVGRKIRSKEKRFKKGTSLKTINAWLEAERTQMRATKGRLLRMRGTLAGDIVAYLTQLPDGRAKQNATWELNAWVPRLGTKRRDKITVDDLRAVVREWLAADTPASTINHRRRALAQLWEALDGPDAPNPVRQVKRAKEVLGEPSAYPMDALEALITGMDASRGRYYKGGTSFHLRNKSRARLRLLLWSGMPPISLQQLDPRRVARDIERGELWYPPRGKGAGAAAVTLKCHPTTIVAVREWLHAHAHGTFSEASLRKALQAAAKTYAAAETAAGRVSAVPVDVTVYDLRHSYLTWLYELTGDPFVVQLYGQHADLETTRRYTRSGVPRLAREVFAGLHAVPPRTSTEHPRTPPHMNERATLQGGRNV